ncbi:MAG: DUF5069 domain-containing protein [Nitrospinae bacterium]|nr:DUF5069 domain-containing protein [Nitrospinota bacterium]
MAMEKVQALDLNSSFPRSPRETMAGLVHLPRMVDKARAAQSGNLGEYIYPCPLDQKILDFLKVKPDCFTQLTVKKEDGQISDWAAERTRDRTQRERDQVNSQILDSKPDASKMSYFTGLRDSIDPTRTDVTTWTDLIDLEEGRL